DMARAVRGGGPHRASGALALHVLQTMTAITHSADRAEFVPLAAQVVPPEPLPEDWDPEEPTLGAGSRGHGEGASP
ncbi:hypothetical protein G3I23_21850, partial [Streptomyces sp. SID10115]|nr:hypothetical protein [Streptomyces sp. SID10115]